MGLSSHFSFWPRWNNWDQIYPTTLINWGKEKKNKIIWTIVSRHWAPGKLRAMIPEEEKINIGRPTLASMVQGERTQVARTHKYQNRAQYRERAPDICRGSPQVSGWVLICLCIRGYNTTQCQGKNTQKEQREQSSGYPRVKNGLCSH